MLKLKDLSHNLDRYAHLDSTQRVQILKDLRQVANIEQTTKCDTSSMCPVTKEAIRVSCHLNSCKFWVDQDWTKNCALNFLLNLPQEKDKPLKDKLTVEQISMLYKKAPRRVESIYKRSFKIVQRHYLKNLLQTRGVSRFSYVAGFCVTCQSKLLEEELNDTQLFLGEGKGYCSAECKKQHPPQYYEIEKFFEADFLQIIEIGSELFNFFFLEDLLGFQPNVLRNRLEKLRDGTRKKS